MTDLHLTRVRHRVRTTAELRPAVLDLVDRLPDALADAFDSAIRPAGAIVCVRRVHTRVRVDAGALEAAAGTLRRWADGLAAAILRDCTTAAARARPAPPSDALVFVDERAALADAVAGAVHGKLDNRWAWRLAGVVRDTDPEDAAALLAGLLGRTPHLLAPVLRGDQAIPRLAQWSWRDWGTAAGAVPRGPASAPVSRAAVIARLHRLLADTEVRRVLALAATARRRASGAGPADPLPATEDSPVLLDATDAAVARLVLAGCAPELADDFAAILAVGSALASAARPAAALDLPPDSVHGADVEPAPTPLAPAEPVAAAAPESAAGEDDFATTAVGGLLFLLPLVERLGWPDRLTAIDAPLSSRPLHEVLRALGARLAETDYADAAVLAFSGRAWMERPTPPPAFSPPELGALDALVAELDLELAALLPAAARRYGAGLRRFVTGRAAVLSGEPGWIEATFAAESADTEIRRAGLDLHPGWVSWLGCVVRYRYV